MTQPEIKIEPVQPLFSVRRLAEYMDVSEYTVLRWWHSGRVPPPDLKITRKNVYWFPETVETMGAR